MRQKMIVENGGARLDVDLTTYTYSNFDRDTYATAYSYTDVQPVTKGLPGAETGVKPLDSAISTFQ